MANEFVARKGLISKNNIQVTGSLSLKFDGVENYFNVVVDGNEKIRINEEGTFTLIGLDEEPTAVAGGIFYSSSNNFYFGFD